jgi:hypothetical protein
VPHAAGASIKRMEHHSCGVLSSAMAGHLKMRGSFLKIGLKIEKV